MHPTGNQTVTSNDLVEKMKKANEEKNKNKNDATTTTAKVNNNNPEKEKKIHVNNSGAQKKTSANKSIQRGQPQHKQAIRR